MGNLTTALSFVLVLNVLMFLTQATILEINPDASNFFSNEGTMLAEFDKGGNVLDTEYSDKLPSAEGSVSPTTGNLFTDMFSSISSWVGQTTGLSYVGNIITAPYNLLKSMNLPTAFVFAIGTLWYVLTLFLVISFFWGRDS